MRRFKMNEKGNSKKDWKLFLEMLPIWQERFMEKLNKEYIQILQQDQNPSSNFWELERRIKEDKKNPGVRVRMSKSEMEYVIISLIRNNVITLDDLSHFSDELLEGIKQYVN